jgi:hypothetical protein
VNNKFELVTKKGRLFARVPGPGKLVVDDAPWAAKKSEATASKKRKKKRGPNFVQRTKAKAKGAGDVRLRIALTKRAIRKALSTGKLNALAGVTYTPTGGDPNTLTFKIRIRL